MQSTSKQLQQRVKELEGFLKDQEVRVAFIWACIVPVSIPITFPAVLYRYMHFFALLQTQVANSDQELLEQRSQLTQVVSHTSVVLSFSSLALHRKQCPPLLIL